MKGIIIITLIIIIALIIIIITIIIRAQQIINTSKDPKSTITTSQLTGTLFYKRLLRKSSMSSKGWKARFFRIQDRILYCYSDNNTSEIKRAIPLEDCVVTEVDSKTQSFVFSVEKKVLNMKFLLRAVDKGTMLKWISLLQAEASCPPEPIITEASKAAMDTQLGGVTGDKAISTSMNLMNQYEKIMTPGQKTRFRFLQQQRTFTSRLAEIAEELRFKEVAVRKFFLRRMMHDLIVPPFVYLPLCRSTDVWTYVIRSLPANCRVFKTKARCPCLMLFEVEEHSKGVDVATFINAELHEYDYSTIAAPTLVEVKTDLNLIKDEEEHEHQQDFEPKPSLFSKRSSEHVVSTVWRAEGTGMNRLGVVGGAISVTKADSAEIVKSQGKPAESSTSSPTPVVKNEFSLIGQRFADKNAKLRSQSPYGHLPNWKIDGLIAKSNDDVRQEVFLMQLMLYIQNAFKQENNSLWLYTYRILSTTKSTGLIQLIPDAISIDELKKSNTYAGSLRKHYEQTFGYTGGPEPPALRNAINAYVQSMAAYSIVSYALAIKDRHNGNIMIDADGHMIHIDFGFILGIAPGKQFSMERAPFKLTEEMSDVMGGRFSADFVEYARLCTQAMLIIRKNVDAISLLMEIMQVNSNFPCFRYNKNAITDFRKRMMSDVPDQDIEFEVNKLIGRSYRHSGTKFYDDFQLATNGILP